MSNVELESPTASAIEDNMGEASAHQPEPSTSSAAGASSPGPHKAASSPKDLPGHRQFLSSSQHRALIIYAWTTEAFAISLGILNSVYTTFGDKVPETLWGFIPALPMIVAAVAEFGRVPLAATLYSKRPTMQMVGLFGIAALSMLAIENWMFGFERAVNLRAASVTSARHELAEASDTWTSLNAERDRLTAAAEHKRQELRSGLDRYDTDLTHVESALEAERKSHTDNLKSIRDNCIVVRERCVVPRTLEENNRFNGVITKLNAQREVDHKAHDELQKQIDGSVIDPNATAVIDANIAQAQRKVATAQKTLTDVALENSMYRIATYAYSWFGFDGDVLSTAQFAKARGVFSLLGATIIALSGTIAALMHYAPDRGPSDTSLIDGLRIKALRARRKYLARKRKQIVREVPVFTGPKYIFKDGVEIKKEIETRVLKELLLVPSSVQEPHHISETEDLLRRLKTARDVTPPAAQSVATPNIVQFDKKG
jgi:hypothetical protein